MERIKVAFFEIESWEKEYLSNKLKDFDLLFFEDELNKDNVSKVSDINILSTFIYSNINKNILSSLKSLKYITTRSTGFDHIDLKTCRKKMILVSNVPNYGSNIVAEHTFALILALSRKIYDSLDRTRKGDFSLENLTGFELKGKTLGVVGTGNIGRKVIKIAKGFEMNILAYDKKRDLKLMKKLGFNYVSINNLFRNSDIITFHIPYNKGTHHLVNKRTLKLFKKGCYLINTSRGGICDNSALLEGLQKGIFSGLGLDVIEGEFFIKEERELLSSSFKKNYDLRTVLEGHVLATFPNVIITPHNAFNSKETLINILNTTINNIKHFAIKKPINLIEKK